MSKDKTPSYRVTNCRVGSGFNAINIKAMVNGANIDTWIPNQFVRNFSKGRPDGSGAYATIERWIAEDRGLVERDDNKGVAAADEKFDGEDT